MKLNFLTVFAVTFIPVITIDAKRDMVTYGFIALVILSVFAGVRDFLRQK